MFVCLLIKTKLSYVVVVLAIYKFSLCVFERPIVYIVSVKGVIWLALQSLVLNCGNRGGKEWLYNRKKDSSLYSKVWLPMRVFTTGCPSYRQSSLFVRAWDQHLSPDLTTDETSRNKARRWSKALKKIIERLRELNPRAYKEHGYKMPFIILLSLSLVF